MATEINAGRVAMVPKGEWSASTAYVRLDVVQYNGSSYVCKQDGTGQNPSTATTYWQLLASGVDPSNYYNKTETNTMLGSKQDALVSGQNIKSINGQSVLGTGDMTIHEEQLIEKSYAPAEFSGLGRKYLQKNIVSDKNVLTQAMMQDANTIYVIQYDYDLNGGSITIPSGCVLQFDGGSLSNGTIVLGKGVNVKSEDVKIFDDVHFTGEVSNQYFHIDWFVGNYATDISSNQPDATAEIQAMFDSGIKKVWLTNKRHYRITDTIVVNAEIIVDGDEQKVGHNDDNKYIFGNLDKPLMTVKAVVNTTNATIHNLYLYRQQSAGSLTRENEYKIDIPTLYVDCTEASIWGFSYNGVLGIGKIPAQLYAADNTTSYSINIGGYTGIEMYAANGHYISYVKLSGYIHDYYRGVNIHKDTSSSWITAVAINYDSEGAYGGYICCNCSISGQHQTRHLLPMTTDSTFFEVNGVCNVDSKCFVWDTSYTADIDTTIIHSVHYSITASRIVGGDMLHDINAKNRYSIKRNTTFQLNGNANLFANLVPNGFYNYPENKLIPQDGGVRNASLRVFETDADYDSYINGDTSKGIAVNESNTFGYYDLFYPDKLYYDDVEGNPKNSNYARKSYVKDVAVKKIYFSCSVSFLERATVVIFAYSTDIESIIVDNGEKVLTYSGSAYYNPIFAPLHQTNSTIQVTVSYKTAQINSDIPYFGICGPGVGNMVGPWGGTVAGQFSATGKGFRYLHHPLFLKNKGDSGSPYVSLLRIYCFNILKVEIDDYYSRYILYISSSGVHIKGGMIRNGANFRVYKSGYYYVISASRLSNATIISVEALSSVGSSVNANATIIDDGSTVDLSTYTLLPNSISATSSGTSTNRPTVSPAMIGTTYFDTTLGKPIYWNGSVWVDKDGYTAASNHGTTANHPTLASTDTGFEYFDTTLGEMNVWSGTKWIQLQNKTKATSETPVGGLLPNVLYHFGVTDNPTITLNITDIDTTIANEWQFTFIAKTSSCAVTMPSNVLLANGFDWNMAAFRCFHVSIKQIPAATSGDYSTDAVYMATVDYIDITPEKNYFTIKSLGDGNVTISIPAEIDSSYMTSISYSKDRINWTDTAINNTAQTITIPVVTNDKVFIKGTGNSISNGTKYINITSSADYEVSGNAMSLFYGENFANKTAFPGGNYALCGLFRGSTTLVNSKDLVLPATTALNGCYDSMFRGCTALRTAPNLPATTLYSGCYSNMFMSCVNLVEAPALPAITLSGYCYTYMFAYCRALQSTPKLAASTLASNSYSYMFYECSSLNHVEMLATNISASACLKSWLYNVASTGTFVKAASMTSLPSGESGIPNGWSVEDASE